MSDESNDSVISNEDYDDVVADDSFDTLLEKEEEVESSEDSLEGALSDGEDDNSGADATTTKCIASTAGVDVDGEVTAFSFVDIKKLINHVKEIIIVSPENRRTSNVMSKFEMTEYVSIRTIQIARFNNCMVDISGLTKPADMARRELMMRKCPLMLRRKVGEKLINGEMVAHYEDWNPAEMTFHTAF